MEKHPIENIMSSTLENLQSMIDVNTVVGSPIFSDSGAVIIPVSQVGFGFVAGGGEYGKVEKTAGVSEQDGARFPFAGGAGAGISVKPTGFLVLLDNMIKFLPIQQNEAIDKLLDAFPGLIREIKEAFSDCGEKQENYTYVLHKDEE